MRHAGTAILLALALGAAAGCASPEKDLERLRAKDNEDRVEAADSLADGIVEGDEEYTARKDDIARALRALLDDRSALVRQAAIDALAAVEGAEATGAIADRLRDRDPWVRFTAAKALGRVGSKSAAEALATVLRQDESEDVRAAAAEALRHMKADARLYDLYLALSDRAPAVRFQAYLALRAITEKDLGLDPRAWRDEISGARPK